MPRHGSMLLSSVCLTTIGLAAWLPGCLAACAPGSSQRLGCWSDWPWLTRAADRGQRRPAFEWLSFEV